MRKISFWAKNHKPLARLAIIAIYILLNCTGVFIGILLSGLDFTFSIASLYGFICLFLAGIVLYPQKYQKGKKWIGRKFYVRQKSCDFILAASSFCMIIFLGNRPEKLLFNTALLNAALEVPVSQPKDSSAKTYKTINNFSFSLKDENGKSLKWKERKKLLKAQIKGIKKANDLSDGEKIALIILSGLVALGLLSLVLALSCNLSCSGAGGAAALVAIGGTALIIFLLVIAIRAINGKKKKQQQNAEKPTAAG
jgi:protein-S-isoprenylcysteine O-methyltransferase Ste14